MTRLKKPIDYIEELLRNPETKALGEKLQKQYDIWIKSLKAKDFCKFIDLIEDNKQLIGVAQFFGKFRAYSLEEYVYRLIMKKCSLPEGIKVFWGEKCLISKPNESEYCMEMDIIVGRKLNNCIKPRIIVDAKVELDASRFKTALASFMLVRRTHPNVKCFLVYLRKEIDDVLLRLAGSFFDGVYSLNLRMDESEDFLKAVQESISFDIAENLKS